MSFLRTLLFSSLTLLCSCSNESKPDKTPDKPVQKKSDVVELNYTLIGSYLHDINSFTEGLLVHEGKVYESTGSPEYLPQTSSIAGVLDLKTGRIEKKVELDKSKYFGEGIVILNGKLYQLTYNTKVGFVYDLKTFKRLKEFSFRSKEGWGMTTDGQHVIMSDGTNLITYLDPESLEAVKSISVTEDGYAKEYLNELEYVDGYIYANVWMTHVIVKIDPKDGKVVARLDLSGLVNDAKSRNKAALEMNGIAYNPSNKSFYVTGKMWANVYEIKLQ